MRRKTREKINEGSNCFHERWIEQCVGLRRSDVNKEDRRQEEGGREDKNRKGKIGGRIDEFALLTDVYIYVCVYVYVYARNIKIHFWTNETRKEARRGEAKYQALRVHSRWSRAEYWRVVPPGLLVRAATEERRDAFRAPHSTVQPLGSASAGRRPSQIVRHVSRYPHDPPYQASPHLAQTSQA